jgi:hypothetical protein
MYCATDLTEIANQDKISAKEIQKYGNNANHQDSKMYDGYQLARYHDLNHKMHIQKSIYNSSI